MEDNNETVGCVGDIEVVVETAAIPEEEVKEYLEQEKEQEENNVNIEMQVDNGKVENE